MSPKNVSLNFDDLVFIQSLFPNVNWSKVNIKFGLPWYMQRSFAGAAVLPDSYLSKLLTISHTVKYPENSYTLQLFYHEAIHVEQYLKLDKKFPIGLGFFRCFMMHYLGWTLALFMKGIFVKKLKIKEALQYAYFENPLEIEAYQKEKLFVSKMIIIKTPTNNYRQLIEENPELIITNSEYNSRPPLWSFILAILLCFLILILKPFLDLFAFCFIKISRFFSKSSK